MFQHVLVPTDLSGQAARAVQIARELTRGLRPRITLLHVIEMLSGAKDNEFESFYRKLEDRATKHCW